MEAQIGDRVRTRLREMRPGLSQAEFAAEVGIPADAFSRSINGKRAFSATELVEIADKLETSAHWFVTGEADPFSIRYAGRHTFNHATKEHEPIDWEATHRTLSDVALAYVQAYGDEPRHRLPARPSTAAAVRVLLEEAGGRDFVRSLADLIEQEFGIDVVRIPGVDKGYAFEVIGRQAIVLGETGNWFYENWSLAHELSHVLRGELSERGDSACDDASAERRANKFAADLLLPAYLISEIDWGTADVHQVAAFLWASGVSTVALTKRLTALKINPSPSVAALLSQKTQTVIASVIDNAEIAERMQAASARRFPAHLVAAHRSGIAAGRLLPYTLAWMLHLDVESLRSELAPPVKPVDMDWLAEQFGRPSASD